MIAVPNKQHAAKRHRHKRRQPQLGRAPLREAEVALVPTQVLETVEQASKKKRQGAGGSFSDGDSSPRTIVQHTL